MHTIRGWQIDFFLCFIIHTYNIEYVIYSRKTSAERFLLRPIPSSAQPSLMRARCKFLTTIIITYQIYYAKNICIKKYIFKNKKYNKKNAKQSMKIVTEKW